MMEHNGSKRPDYLAKSVIETGRLGTDGKVASRWREVGVAFENPKSGTITILLDALPLGGKLILTRPKDEPAQPQPPKLYDYKNRW